MKAETVGLLTTKGQFPTEQALAVAEAIAMALRDARLVTVPILDGRFATFEARLAALEARFVALEARVEAKLAAFEARVDAKLAAFEARMDQKFDRLRLQLIVAILIGYAAMGPLGNAALEALRRLF